MNRDIRNLEPQAIWNNFSDLNAIPRASKKEERIIRFMVKFGEKLNLDTSVDDVGNVLIKKQASQGMEDRKIVVLQSHLDMVHQKNSNIEFNFDTQGIEMLIDGEWVTANGTTLGADNGLGVAAIMSVLASTTLKHPPLEALFTIDEETGMTGAMGLQAGFLSGEILLNLDTEEDDEIDIGCAGGIDISAKKTYHEVNTPPNSCGFTLTVKGLKGGHSGMDIHKGLGNANKIMNRLLFGVQEYSKISKIKGGGLRNAIPRESMANLTVLPTEVEKFLGIINQISHQIKKELSIVELDLEIDIQEITCPDKVMTKMSQSSLLKAIYAAHNGVYTMSREMEDLVETSNNIAQVIVEDEIISLHCLTRSSVESSKWDLVNTLKSTFELAGFVVSLSGDYPGWEPDIDSPILGTMRAIYRDLFGENPKVVACHAGLECGILGKNYPNMDMISFGPTIEGAHSPDERAHIKSTQKFWKFLTTTLENIPAKK
jgi:dipeptidase D